MTAASAAKDPHPSLPWGRTLLVLGVIALAHVAAWMLLTAGARRDIRRHEARFTTAALLAAEEPGVRPAEPADLPAWLRRQALWEAHQDWAQRTRLVSLLAHALLASFLVQAGVTAVLLVRSVRRRRPLDAG